MVSWRILRASADGLGPLPWLGRGPSGLARSYGITTAKVPKGVLDARPVQIPRSQGLAEKVQRMSVIRDLEGPVWSLDSADGRGEACPYWPRYS